MNMLELREDATYTAQAQYTIESSRDYDDHTFFGIMFDIQVKPHCPLHHASIDAISIRGMLGRVNVWFTPDSHAASYNHASRWRNIYSSFESPSLHELRDISFASSILLQAGESIGIYIHCERTDDKGLVYDDQRSDVSYEDDFLKVLPGMAHVSPVPFSDDSYGFWACKLRMCNRDVAGANERRPDKQLTLISIWI